MVDYVTSVRNLSQEIGAGIWAGSDNDAKSILCSWTRLLLQIVSRHASVEKHEYTDLIIEWCDDIRNSYDDQMREKCCQVKSMIHGLDPNTSGPTNHALGILHAICIAAKYSLDDHSFLGTGWLSESSVKVWRLATGSGNVNEIVTISRMAWQQHLFAQAIALAEKGRKGKSPD